MQSPDGYRSNPLTANGNRVADHLRAVEDSAAPPAPAITRNAYRAAAVAVQMFSSSPVHPASSIGPMMSPQILAVPAMQSKRSIGFSSTGTSLATGFPLFVIMIGLRCSATSSIRRRQLVLNSAAGTCLILLSIIL